jgi:hypothetical protein
MGSLGVRDLKVVALGAKTSGAGASRAAALRVVVPRVMVLRGGVGVPTLYVLIEEVATWGSLVLVVLARTCSLEPLERGVSGPVPMRACLAELNVRSGPVTGGGRGTWAADGCREWEGVKGALEVSGGTSAMSETEPRVYNCRFSFAG